MDQLGAGIVQEVDRSEYYSGRVMDIFKVPALPEATTPVPILPKPPTTSSTPPAPVPPKPQDNPLPAVGVKEDPLPGKPEEKNFQTPLILEILSWHPTAEISPPPPRASSPMPTPRASSPMPAPGGVNVSTQTDPPDYGAMLLDFLHDNYQEISDNTAIVEGVVEPPFILMPDFSCEEESFSPPPKRRRLE